MLCMLKFEVVRLNFHVCGTRWSSINGVFNVFSADFQQSTEKKRIRKAHKIDLAKFITRVRAVFAVVC